MADNIVRDQQPSSDTTKMPETDSSKPEPTPNPNPNPNPNPIHNISFSIWPPSQRTRDAVTTRLIETLTSESVLSKRYGTVPKEEAADLAKKLEEEAFVHAGKGAVKPEDDGIETLQVYSKEISKRMLDAVKSRSDSSGGGAAVKEEKVVAGEVEKSVGDGAVEEGDEGASKAAEE